MYSIDVFSTAYSFQEEEMRDKTIVVIDVLRACSTIVTALHSGAKEVIAVEDMAAAGKIAQNLDQSRYLLCGERDGEKIDGYHLGNSPVEYTPETVKGKTLILNSTNGTPTLNKTSMAKKLIVGSFLNLSAVVNALREADNEIILVCAGWKNRLSLEDTLCAGMIINKLNGGVLPEDARDGARVAYVLSERYKDQVEQVLQSTNHADRLRHLGYEKDISYCAQIDITDTLPILKEGTIKHHHG